MIVMFVVKTQRSVVIGAPLLISWKASGLMRATLVSQKLPQASFKATANNSAYRCDWRSPGAPITSKWVFDLDGVHIFSNVCFCISL